MKYADYKALLHRALYEYGERNAGSYIRFQTLTQQLGIAVNSSWLGRFAEEMETGGYVEVSKTIGPYENWSARIRARGAQLAEEELENNAGWGLTAPPEPPLTHHPEAVEETISSAAWTGRPTLPANNVEQLRAALLLAERGLDNIGAGNSEKAQARALVVAARALADAPEPPEDLIWELVQRANGLAGIAGLLVSIIALFV